MDRADVKDRILAAIPIESYIGRYVALKKAGRSLTGLCPFHSEKSPSFHVTPEKGLYHCFGCQKGGNLFTFVMDMEGLSFNEALETLARYAGIEIERDKSHGGRHEALYQGNERAAKAFQSFLTGGEGAVFRDYASSRKIAQPTMDLFRMGACPERWQWLETAMGAGTADRAKLLELGLIRPGKDQPYDFFRGRLMFPIRDISGNIVAFGGRALPGKDKEVKYLNSPDSSIFRKGSVLFGLYEGMAAVRKEREVILVEGYLDVIGLSQAGVRNVVAPLGTALTAPHVRLLMRYVSDLRAVFDGDKAGRSAALKFARLVVDYEGIRGNVVLLPTGQDPFDVSVNYQESRIREVFACSISAGQYLLMETLYPEITQAEILKHSTRDPFDFGAEMARFYADPAADLPSGVDHKRDARGRLFELVRGLKQASERELFIREGARLLRLDPDNLVREFAAGDPGESVRDPGTNRVAPLTRSALEPVSLRQPRNLRSGAGDDPLARGERELIADFLVAPTAVGACRGAMADFEFLDEHSEIAWRYLESRYLTGDLWTPDSIPTFELPPETLAVFTGLVIHRAENAQPTRESALEIVNERILKHRILVKERILKELADGLTAAADREGAMRDYSELVKEVSDLKLLWSRGKTVTVK